MIEKSKAEQSSATDAAHESTAKPILTIKAKRKEKTKRKRRTPLFPAASFEESLTLAEAIQKHAAGQRVRRLTLFDQMGKSPDSSGSRQIIINSTKYGLTKGGYAADYLELTPDGITATGLDVPLREKTKIHFKLAIDKIKPFNALYTAQKGNRLPAKSVLEDIAKEQHVPADDVKECVDMFIVNAKFVKILKTMSGAERIVPIEQAIEELPSDITGNKINATSAQIASDTSRPLQIESDEQDWGNICFHCCPR